MQEGEDEDHVEMVVKGRKEVMVKLSEATHRIEYFTVGTITLFGQSYDFKLPKVVECNDGEGIDSNRNLTTHTQRNET